MTPKRRKRGTGTVEFKYGRGRKPWHARFGTHANRQSKYFRTRYEAMLWLRRMNEEEPFRDLWMAEMRELLWIALTDKVRHVGQMLDNGLTNR